MFPNRQMIEYADAVYNAMNDEMVYRVKFNDRAGPIMIDACQLENISEMDQYQNRTELPVHRHINEMLRRCVSERNSLRADNRGVHEFPPKIVGISARTGRRWTISGTMDETVYERIIRLEYEGDRFVESRAIPEVISRIDQDLAYYGRRSDIGLADIREELARGRDLPDGTLFERVEYTPRDGRFEFNYARAFVEARPFAVEPKQEINPKPAPEPKSEPAPEPPPTSPFKHFEV